MKQCPRCGNEQLKEEYKYCQICGGSLEEPTIEQVIEYLKESRDRYKYMYTNEFIFEISCLGIAIKELERTTSNSEEVELNKETALRIAPLIRLIIDYATRKNIPLNELELAFKMTKENYILIHKD